MRAAFRGAPAVARPFLDYLEARLHVGPLHFAEGPTPILDGWETYIYRFRLSSPQPMPPPFDGPLILRIYACERGLPLLRHEVAVQNHLHQLGQPVAHPLLIEEDGRLFGGPFMVMECLPGRTLFDWMLYRPWRIVDGPMKLAAEQARLHQLSPAGFPTAPGPYLSRRLEELRDTLAEFALDGLGPGLDWLERNRPASPSKPCIVHLDFHPINVLFHRGRCTGILDWGESDLGDREADVGTTLVLIETAYVTIPHLWQQATALPGRWILWYHYRFSYRRLLPLDEDRLSYYMALTALRRLARYGAWLRASPGVTGSRPSSLSCVSARRLALLRRCFHRETGVAVQLAMPKILPLPATL
jgi:aminoglycoside phosphotransferase (APT) family kinase protein